MSQHKHTTDDGHEVLMGYDRPLNFVFCVVADADGDAVYSNLSDPQAGTDQQDVEYYRPILAGLGITVPETMFTETATDQRNREGNRIVRHGTDARKRKPEEYHHIAAWGRVLGCKGHDRPRCHRRWRLHL